MDLFVFVFGFLVGLFAMQRRPDLWPNLCVQWPEKAGEAAEGDKDE